MTAALDAIADSADAARLRRFFKTGPGDYGEGDVFIGVRMPAIRAVVREFRELPLDDVRVALASAVHEHRMAALVICCEQARRAKKRGDTRAQQALFDFYLAHTDRINNWDLVDVTCRDVVGEYLLTIDDARPLKRLARSSVMWERRIAIVSTWSFIRARQLGPTFEIAELLLDDQHDLMHKATGWMLREAGKKDEAALERFLGQFAARMARTTLRYSIERLAPERRRYWLAYGRRS
ncbi:MAG: DNA alkylation repair protein [Solirubrobacterales bacterium]